MELLSLFCGPGGLDSGFRKAGFATLSATDVDESALSTFEHNHPSADVFRADLLSESVTAIVSRALQRKRGAEAIGVIGGPPCQSFSSSNVHQKALDPRHNLPLHYAGILRRLNVDVGVSFFVFENVLGLLSQKHAARYTEFKRQFEAAGFVITESVLDAQDYGVPQKRPRLFIVGINQKIHKGMQWTPPVPHRSRRRTVRDAISGLPKPTFFRRGLTDEDIPFHPNHWCMRPLSKKFGTSDLTPGQAWGRSFRTLEWDQPSWAVAYGHREVHVHPSGDRRLSVYEAMLLQSFPRQYQLIGTLSSQIKQVSNAVPPELGAAVGSSIAIALRA